MTTIPVKISNTGMTSDAFERSALMRTLVNFDIKTFANQLLPYHSSESGDSSASTQQIANFVTAGSTLYGLGVVSGTSFAEVFSKTDFTNATWGTPANNQSSSGAVSPTLFVYYQKVGKIFGARAGSAIWSFQTSGGGWTETAQSIVYATVAQGIVHSKDDILYVPYNNKIAKNDNDSWTASALVLPTGLVITSICEYGNYLAIACQNPNQNGTSKVFLWDRDSSVATLAECIDWGSGQIKVLEEVNGYLIGISQLASGTSAFKDRLIFRYYAGGAPEAIQYRELLIDGTTLTLTQAKQKANNRVYFLATTTINSTVIQGIWSTGRHSDGSFFVTFEYLPNNDTGLTSGTLNGFFLYQQYAFTSYVSSSTYGMSKTDDMANYTATSYFETAINPRCPEEEYDSNKQLRKFGVSFSPLSSGQQIVAKYRVDGGSWKTIFTKTFSSPTADVANYTSNRDASSQFDQGIYYEFRVESTGGAVPVAYIWDYMLLAQQQ